LISAISRFWAATRNGDLGGVAIIIAATIAGSKFGAKKVPA
jgi:hypothetical protein